MGWKGKPINYFCGIAAIQNPLWDITDEGHFSSNYIICITEPKIAWLNNDEGKYTTKAKVVYELRKITYNKDGPVESIQIFSTQ